MNELQPQPPLTPAERRQEISFERRVFRATLIVIATTAAVWLAWTLIDVLLLLFACALVALILLTVSGSIRKRTGLPFGVTLSLSVLILLAVIVGSFAFFGAALSGEFAELARQLPGAWGRVQLLLQQYPIGRTILANVQQMTPSGGAVMGVATTALSTVGGALSALVLVLVGGLYLAAQPTLYGVGLLRMLPTSMRGKAADTLDAISVSLKNWLKGQALGMVFVGLGTWLGLWLVGVPAAAAIGLVAGLAEFVPYAGIIVAGIPAVLLGFGQGTDTGLWTIGVLFAVQQIQGNLVMPLLQNRMVDLPPAVTIFGIIAAGILFGVAGVLLATPLTIVVLVLLRRLYLGEEKETVLDSGDQEDVPPPLTANE